MDEMRIESKFLQNIISKILKKVLNKQLGINPEICFWSPIEAKIENDTAQVHIDIVATVPTNDIVKILKI